MTNSDAIREFEEKYGIAYRSDNMHADLTALISEHYVAKEEVDKMVSERDDDIFDKMNCLIGYLERWLNNPQSYPPVELGSVIDEAVEHLKKREL